MGACGPGAQDDATLAAEAGRIVFHPETDPETFLAWVGSIWASDLPEPVAIYRARDADTLLRQETNWELPIAGLWHWIRGLPDPDMPAKITLDQQGLIQDLQQNEWQIQYKRYQQFGAYYFPRKIVVQHKDMKVRLVVTQWVVS